MTLGYVYTQEGSVEVRAAYADGGCNGMCIPISRLGKASHVKRLHPGANFGRSFLGIEARAR